MHRDGYVRDGLGCASTSRTADALQACNIGATIDQKLTGILHFRTKFILELMLMLAELEGPSEDFWYGVINGSLPIAIEGNR